MDNPHLERPPAHVALAADRVHARATADGQRIELKPFNSSPAEAYMKLNVNWGQSVLYKMLTPDRRTLK